MLLAEQWHASELELESESAVLPKDWESPDGASNTICGCVRERKESRFTVLQKQLRQCNGDLDLSYDVEYCNKTKRNSILLGEESRHYYKLLLRIFDSAEVSILHESNIYISRYAESRQEKSYLCCEEISQISY